jgi:sortase (surface protein transpeptidase)
MGGMTLQKLGVGIGGLALVAGLAGCGAGGEVRLVGQEVALASSAAAAPVPPLAAPSGLAPAPEPTAAGQRPAGLALAPPAPLPATELPAPLPATAEPADTTGWLGSFLGPTPVPPTATREPTWTPVPTATPPPTATPDALADAGNPAQIEIPSIGVVALVEQVGLTSDGAMDTPRGWMNAAWFEPGFRPGEAGNAVIAGHLDSRSGGPAVFWSLNRLQPGDEVKVSYENGDSYTFAVQDLEAVPYNIEGEAVKAIFGPSQTSDLNLITCNGPWDVGKATYTERLVVYTTLMPEKTVHGGFQGSFD